MGTKGIALLFLTIVLPGCWTQRSRSGDFVHRVSLAEEGLRVTWCDIRFEKDHSLLTPHHRGASKIGVKDCHSTILVLSGAASPETSDEEAER